MANLPRTALFATRSRLVLRLVAGLGLTALVVVGPHSWRAQAATNRFVAVGGSDMSNDCSNSLTPCGSIQHAVDQSASGDTINVAAGTYTEHVIVSQNVTIQGDAFSPSIVNGGGTGRVFVIIAGPVTLSMLTITNGNGLVGGGGILIDGGRTLTVIQCTISGNTAGTGNSMGGGIFSGGEGSTLTVINSTISGNTAHKGGGIDNGPDAIATLVNTTINGNTAAQGGGLINETGATLNLTNTIIAGSLAGGDCVNQGIIVTNSHNLVQDGSCPALFSPATPNLGALANNGGPTFTHALLPGSPAIDAGDDTVLGPPFNLTTDQRGPGFPRKVGAHVDIGAFEAQFDTCLKDNASSNLLQWNSVTGQ